MRYARLTMLAACALALAACSDDDTVVGGTTTTSGGGSGGSGGAGGAGGAPECPPPCGNDQHCVQGECTPWDGYSEGCNVPPEPFLARPHVACHWPPVGVPMTEGPASFQWARGVSSTVMAAPFLPPEGTEFPVPPPTWLVIATGSVLGSPAEATSPGSPWHAGGVLRVLDPQSCTLVDTLDEAQVASWFQPPAIGDLDGDGRPEIVAQAWKEVAVGQANYNSAGPLVAWTYDLTAQDFVLYASSTVNGNPEADLSYSASYHQMSGPSIADLDDDGVPEVILAGRVYNNLLQRLTGEAPPTTPLMMSNPPPSGPFLIQLDTIADLNADGVAELVYGDHIFSWSAAGGAWQTASFFAPPAALGIGHAVVADMGTFPASPDAGAPEIVVVGYDGVRVQSIDGTVLTSMALLGGPRGGGAPSVANVDDDPEPEIIVGTDTGVFVYDLGCDTATPGPECGVDAGESGGLPPLPQGVRWADRPPVDNWDFMGGTTFDFDGDGKLEVLYADECFLRVYAGETGKVIFSRWRPSRTASEVPTIVGASGGSETVIAIGLHTAKYCSQAVTPPYDQQFPGLPCLGDEDCFGGAGSCVGGLCRCTDDAHCCAPGDDCPALGYACHEPPAGDTDGNTCRAVRILDASEYAAQGVLEEGVDVLGDSFGRWAAARPIWNQDAYVAAGVSDLGVVPATSAVPTDFSAVERNSFRSNFAGAISALGAPDLTARDVTFGCDGGSATSLSATVCNRGARPAMSGQLVHFEDGDRRMHHGRLRWRRGSARYHGARRRQPRRHHPRVRPRCELLGARRSELCLTRIAPWSWSKARGSASSSRRSSPPMG